MASPARSKQRSDASIPALSSVEEVVTAAYSGGLITQEWTEEHEPGPVHSAIAFDLDEIVDIVASEYGLAVAQIKVDFTEWLGRKGPDTVADLVSSWLYELEQRRNTGRKGERREPCPVCGPPSIMARIAEEGGEHIGDEVDDREGRNMGNSDHEQSVSTNIADRPISNGPLASLFDRLKRNPEISVYDDFCREGRNPRHIEIKAIGWGRLQGGDAALYALNRLGWDQSRIAMELTESLARNDALVCGLLADLVMRASHEAQRGPGFSESDADALRVELRRFSRCPFARLKCRLRARERFVREMLSPKSAFERGYNERGLDPVPDWLAVEVAKQTLTTPKEFLLWDPSRISWFVVRGPGGECRYGDFGLLDRGDRVEVHPCGIGRSEEYFTGIVSQDGRLSSEPGPNPIYAVGPDGDVQGILWEDCGIDRYELYFGRADQIQYEFMWVPAWLAEVEDRLCDIAAESIDDEDDWEP